MQNTAFWVSLLFLAAFFSSCNLTKALVDDERLLVKNKINIEGDLDSKRSIKEVLESLPYQKPNKKIFGVVPFRLGIYNLTVNKRDNKFRYWLQTKVGEAPIIFNEDLADKSAANIRTYMFNKGYLHASVNYNYKVSKKKLKLDYNVIANDRFYIDSVFFPEPVDLLTRTIEQTIESSLLEKDNAFDISVLEEERKKISTYLRNRGYYYFNKDFIGFDLDSNQLDKTINIYVKVNKPERPLDQIKYRVNKIYVETDYSINTAQVVKDTLKLENHPEFYILSKELKYKPEILYNGIFFEHDAYFHLEHYQKTVRKLTNYGTFKFVDVQFEDRTDDLGKPTLDVKIYLTPGKKQSIGVDVEANHSFEGFTGTALSFTYKNRNLFQGADLLEFRVSTGLEFQFGDSLVDILNTARITSEINYYLNRFLVPFPLKNVSKNNNVKSIFSLKYQFERRLTFYSLHSNTFSFGYEWNETTKKKHIYNPLALNLLLINKDTAFIRRLEEIPSLERSFEEQIIAGSNYTYLTTNKNGEFDKSHYFFKGDVRFAGNFVHTIARIKNNKNGNIRPFKIGNTAYSQFFRVEGDLVHYLTTSRHSKLVSRVNMGIIVPYGNSRVAPYFQQFYAGGANSIRAFRLRALGPGSYADTANLDNPNFFYDQSGDIKFETSMELRFDIYKWFKGAVFMDAGNVWLLRKDEGRPGGDFKFDTFHKSIALGTGIGLRLDFEFFVIRTDLAFPIRDPRLLDSGDQWVIKDFNLGSRSWRRQNLVFNLAIGYPF